MEKKAERNKEVKSISLEIAQVEESPELLHWQIRANGLKSSGTFEVSTVDDCARFTACAAHVFYLAFEKMK
jgi:hypothetical protein